MQKYFYVYILASRRNGTLYIGITSDLVKRVWKHKNKLADGFTTKYNINKLVYFEQLNDAKTALNREKRLKKYNRQWKLNLIEQANNKWKDLYEEITSGLSDQVGQ